MEVKITFVPITKLLLALLFLSAVVISFTIGDKTDSDAISISSSLSPFTSSSLPEEVSKTDSSDQLSLISPKKLALFAKALQNLVQNQCSNINDLGLDAFQAYLSRQILKKGDEDRGRQTLKHHPLHFNSLYENLTACAAAAAASLHSSSSTSILHSPDHYLENDRSKSNADDADGNHNATEESNKRNTDSSSSSATAASHFPSSSQNDSALLSSTSSADPSSSNDQFSENESWKSSSPSKELPTTEINARSDLQPKKLSLNEKFAFPTIKNDSKFGDRFSKNNTNLNLHYHASSIMDKIIFNMTVFTEGVTEGAKNIFYNLFQSLVTTLFDANSSKRKRRNAENGIKTVNTKSSYYSRVPIPSKPEDEMEKNVNDDPQDNYKQIWNSVTASETKMTAYFHVIHTLKNFIAIAVATCPPKFQVDESLLITVCEFMATLIMDDLIEAESTGMRMEVNEELENQLDLCLQNITFTEQQQQIMS